jgi:hypothetical protein
VHTLRRNNRAPLSPVFAYMGFQYVKVVATRDSSFLGRLEGLTALEIHPDVTPTGRLTFGGDGVAGSPSEDGAEVLRGVNTMVLASQLSNLAPHDRGQPGCRRRRAGRQSGGKAEKRATFVQRHRVDECIPTDCQLCRCLLWKHWCSRAAVVLTDKIC